MANIHICMAYELIHKKIYKANIMFRMENNKEKNKNLLLKDISNLDFLICVLVVLVLFLPTLNRPWLMYDERSIFTGLYFPIPHSFSEIVEIINSFGLNFNIISSNTIYSSNYITRTAPFTQILWLFLNLFFQLKPVLYHAFSLLFHIINSFLLFLILKTIIKTGESNNQITILKRVLCVTLTLIWAVHPVNIESVLLATNFGALFSYAFFFGFLLDFLINRKKESLLRGVLIPVLFLIPMLTNEYIVSLPLVIFVFSLYYSLKNNSFKKALRVSSDETRPYFIGLILYVLYFLFISNHRLNQYMPENAFATLFERIFWLSPQLFFHDLKLIFFPNILSIDQTLFVKLGKTLTDPYSIFCILLLAAWLLIPGILFLMKKKMSNLFLISWSFFFALFPFLHILAPSYALVAERYLYCPLAVLLIGLLKLVIDFTQSKPYIENKILSSISFLLIISLVGLGIRSYLRTYDWKDNYTFINASYKTSKEPLFKAMRLGMLSKIMATLEPQRKEEIRVAFLETLSLLEEAKKETLEKKKRYQKHIPAVIKAYGLDYDSLLAKIAFLEASSKCLELGQDQKVGLEILQPFTKNPKRLDPRITELYAHLLVIDKQYEKARDVLLEALVAYPDTNFLLSNTIDVYNQFLKDKDNAEKYVTKALSLYLYDSNILLKALSFYQNIKNDAAAAKYAYLYGLRTGTNGAYIHALSSALNINDLKFAKKMIDKLLKTDSANPEALYFISKYYYQKGDNQKALEYLVLAHENLKFIKTTQDVAFDITNNLAKLYSGFGMNEKAEAFKDQIFSLAGDNPDLLIKAAKFYKSAKLEKHYNACVEKIKKLGYNVS